MFITMQMCLINRKHDLDKTMMIGLDNLSSDYDSFIYSYFCVTFVHII